MNVLSLFKVLNLKKRKSLVHTPSLLVLPLLEQRMKAATCFPSTFYLGSLAAPGPSGRKHDMGMGSSGEQKEDEAISREQGERRL